MALNAYYSSSINNFLSNPSKQILGEIISSENWFLNGKNDVRSSFYMEDTACEFDIQGLELDWVGVCWDAGMRWDDNLGWDLFKFSGTKWQKRKKESEKRYLLNAYRVLLTRARQGQIIFIPNGDVEDETRLPKFYDRTFEYLLRCGFIEV